MEDEKQTLARSFGSVAQSYASARPTYPREAAEWLVDGGRPDTPISRVLELGAGTGRLTERLTGHRVLATDPSPEMLGHLRAHLPQVPSVVAAAEHIPAPSRTYDTVVAAQAFHWFDHDVALPEIARVLRPGGHLALVWNVPDESTPWVRRLLRLVPRPVSHDDDVTPMRETAYFGFVEENTWRIWQRVDRAGLLNWVRSRSPYAVADEDTRAQMLEAVGALYDDYDRGSAGLQMPFLTRCYRAQVRQQDPEPPRPVPAADPPAGDGPASGPSIEDDGTLLIDFR